jgi:hypothetical protein
MTRLLTGVFNANVIVDHGHLEAASNPQVGLDLRVSGRRQPPRHPARVGPRCEDLSDRGWEQPLEDVSAARLALGDHT